MVNVLNVDNSFKELENRLSNSKRVVFSRFGDGDLLLLSRKLNTKIGKSNKTVITESLKEQIRNAMQIDDPSYLIAVAWDYECENGMKEVNLQPFNNNNKLRKLFQSFHIKDKKYLNAICFHYVSVYKAEYLKSFINKYIKNCRKCVISSRPKEILEKIFGDIHYFIEIPETNSYKDFNRIWDEVKQCSNDIDVVLPFCGFTTRALNMFIYKDLTVDSIDIGSFIDPICGVINRTWIKVAGDIIVKNFSDLM